jgi:hypothetical protein
MGSILPTIHYKFANHPVHDARELNLCKLCALSL